MKSQRNNYKTSGDAPRRSSEQTRTNGNFNHFSSNRLSQDEQTNSNASANSSVLSVHKIVVPNGLLSQYLTKKLNADGYINRAGKYCYDLSVGNRIEKFEKLQKSIEDITNSKLFIKRSETVSNNIVSIININLTGLAEAVDYIVSLNDKMKLKSDKTEKIILETRRIDLVFPMIDNLEQNIDYPTIEAHLEGNQIVISGQSDQVDKAVNDFQQHYIRVFGLPSKQHKTKVSSPKTVIAVSSIAELPTDEPLDIRKSRMETIVQQYGCQEALEDKAVNDDSDSDSNSNELNVRDSNRQVRPPSKNDISKRIKRSGGRVKRNNQADYYADSEQLYAVVTDIYGGNRAKVEIISLDDDLFRSSIIGRISGSMSRRSKRDNKVRSSNRLDKGSIVVVSKRDFQENIVDIIKKVPEDVIKGLIRDKEIPSNYFIDPLSDILASDSDDMNCGFDFVDTLDDDFDVDAI
jgi:hypothetical protein